MHVGFYAAKRILPQAQMGDVVERDDQRGQGGFERCSASNRSVYSAFCQAARRRAPERPPAPAGSAPSPGDRAAG
ncbi:hypothetical protein M8494_09510 [Serratia ureilytica]